LARPLRIEYPGAYYHVMNRGLSRRHTFIENQDRKGFLDLIGDLSRLWKVGEENPESRRVFRPELEEIVEATATYYGKTLGELKKRRRGHENEARGMAIYLGRRLGGYKLTEIGRAMGVGKYSTVSSACLVMKERIERDRRVARRAKQIEQSLSKGHQRI